MKVPDRLDCLLQSPPKASQSNKVEKGLRGGIFDALASLESMLESHSVSQ